MKHSEGFLKTLARGLSALSPNCKEAVRLQSDALDRKPSFLQRFGLRAHLLICKWCRRYGEQVTFLRSAAEHSPQHDDCAPAHTLSSEARERIKKRLQS